MTTKIIFYIISLIVVLTNGAEVKERIFRCADKLCSVPVSRGRTILKYPAPDSSFLSFESGLDVTIYGKPATRDQNYAWAEIDTRRGLVPLNLIREDKILSKISQTVVIPTPVKPRIVKKDLSRQFPDEPEVKSQVQEEIKSQAEVKKSPIVAEIVTEAPKVEEAIPEVVQPEKANITNDAATQTEVTQEPILEPVVTELPVVTDLPVAESSDNVTVEKSVSTDESINAQNETKDEIVNEVVPEPVVTLATDQAPVRAVPHEQPVIENITQVPKVEVVTSSPVVEEAKSQPEVANETVVAQVEVTSQPEVVSQPEVLSESEVKVPTVNPGTVTVPPPDTLTSDSDLSMVKFIRESAESYRKFEHDQLLQDQAPEVTSEAATVAESVPESNATEPELEESKLTEPDSILTQEEIVPVQVDVKLDEITTSEDVTLAKVDTSSENVPLEADQAEVTVETSEIKTVPEIVELPHAAIIPEVTSSDQNDTLTGQEVGDALTDVYFGILKEYFCKIDLVFEKAPKAAFGTMVIGILWIVMMALKLSLVRKSKESQLSTELSNLQGVMYRYTIERKHLTNQIETDKDKINSLEENLADSNATIEEYQLEMQTLRTEREQLEIDLKLAKKQLREERDACVQVRQQVNSKDEKFEKLDQQIRELTNDKQRLESLVDELESSLEELKTNNEALEEAKDQLETEKQTLEAEKVTLANDLDTVKLERDNLTTQSLELATELQNLTLQLKLKTEEVSTLNGLLQELEAAKESEDPVETVHDILDIVQIRVKNEQLEEENKQLLVTLGNIEASWKKLEDETSELRIKTAKCEELATQAVNEKQEAVKNLEVLTKYFKEKEIDLQKELGAQQVRRSEWERDATSLEKRLQELEQEKESYKGQLDSMRKELSDSERSFKTQIAILDKKAHDNWVAARNYEREVNDLRRDATFLRQQLTLMAKNGNSDTVDAADMSGPSSMFEFMPPPPPPVPGPFSSLDFSSMMANQSQGTRPSSSASGPTWELGNMPPPPPMPPMGIPGMPPFMPGMPFPPMGNIPGMGNMPPVTTSYSETYSHRMSPISRHSQSSPTLSTTNELLAGDGDLSRHDFSSHGSSFSSQPHHHQQQQQQQYYQSQNQLQTMQQQHQQPMNVSMASHQQQFQQQPPTQTQDQSWQQNHHQQQNQQQQNFNDSSYQSNC